MSNKVPPPPKPDYIRWLQVGTRVHAILRPGSRLTEDIEALLAYSSSMTTPEEQAFVQGLGGIVRELKTRVRALEERMKVENALHDLRIQLQEYCDRLGVKPDLRLVEGDGKPTLVPNRENSQ